MTRIRVASYNLRGFHDDRHAAARTVRRLAPDVLCVQEVPRWFARSRVAAFARECGLEWSGPLRGSGGTAIFTSDRVHLLRTERQRLPLTREAEWRGFSWAVVRAPGGRPVAVASVHLTLEATGRLTEIRRVLRQLERAGTPTLLAGDLNESADQPAWRRAATEMRQVSPVRPTFTARTPRRMIDAIFASPEFLGLPHEEVALDRADLIAATDHLPIWADLDLRD
ncbi:MAG: endonuclease/exonuclease/phosphatase family protein [Dermatophilaceae bacterium]